jgi:SAM-dependent methyltransferase
MREPEAAGPPREWFATPLGRALLALEARRLSELLPGFYGTIALQLGRLAGADLLAPSPIATHILLDAAPPAESPRVGEVPLARLRGLPEELPCDGRSADLVLLPHTLDFCADPHQVLRETARVLKPEGHAVVLGFNPWSLWGLRRVFARRPRRRPWDGRFLPLARIKDWLGLLDFELTHGRMLFYRPPYGRASVMKRLHFLDRMGDRWWPLLAAVYLVVARKRVPGVTPMPLEWTSDRAVAEVAALPARRSATAFAHPGAVPGARGIVLPFRERGDRGRG